MEQTYCTAVFWRGGEKIELNGLEPDAVRCLSVTGERKVNLSFLRDYPNLEELTLMEKCEGVEVLSGLNQLHTLSLWLSAPVSWDNVSLPGLRVLHLRGEKNGDITPLLTSITYLHLEEMRKTEDLPGTMFLSPACVSSTCVGKRMATLPRFSPALPISIWRKCEKRKISPLS